MITEMLHIDNGVDDLPTKDRLKQHQLILAKEVDSYFAWVKKNMIRLPITAPSEEL